jgi:hypothetical protein
MTNRFVSLFMHPMISPNNTVASAPTRRALVVLIIAATIGVLLLQFPGPLFQGTARAPSFSPQLIEMLPMNADHEEILEMRQRATDAMAALEAKKARRE